MDNRNHPSNPRSRKDSVTDKERRGMQQGYPVRDDATMSFDRPINRPAGPREVPQSMRQGKIPVRENASKGRTIPVMNRNGQPVRPAPAEIPETAPLPESDTEILQAPVPEEIPADMPAIEEAENTVLEAAAEEAPVSDVPDEPEENEGAEDSAEPETMETQSVPEDAEETVAEDSEETVTEDPEETVTEDPEETITEDVQETVTEEIPEAEPAPEEEETAVCEEPESVAEPEDTETAADTETVPDEGTPAEDMPPAPAPAASEPAAPEPEEPVRDEPEIDPDEELLMILHRRRKPQADAPEEIPAAEGSPVEAPAETSEEAEPVLPTAADTPSETGENSGGGKKLWLLPLVIAILAALAMTVGIPAFFTSSETIPDFDMTLSYGKTQPEAETGIPDETGGAGREESPETDSTPPETTPPAVKFNVTLDFFERDSLTVSTSEITLEALLERVNYIVLDTDRFSVAMDTLLTEEITITVDTVTYGTATETIVIPFETKTTNVQTIPRGQRNVTQYGKEGSKTITYTTEIVNGMEVSRTVAKEEITLQPVTETCQVGIGGTLVGNDGKTYSYSYYRMVNATYYDIKGLTYLGYEADESVVAVDMDYIPLGTKIYVRNDQFDFGVRVAADTGSMIEGWEVDIWLDDSNPQKKDFAYIGYVKNMIIYYLD